MIENYTNLTISKYKEIVDIIKDEARTEDEKMTGVIAVLCDSDEDVIVNLPILEYKQLAQKAKFLDNEPVLYRIMRGTIKVGKWELVVPSSIKGITAAQYIDFQTYSQDQSNLVEMLSCFLVPKGCKYAEGYDVAELHRDLLEKMSVVDALSVLAFFLTRLRGLITNMLISLRLMSLGTSPRKRAIRREASRLLSILAADGDGSHASMQ